jgi:transcription antitermination factor NusG
MNNEIEDLIAELKLLQVRQRQVLARLEEAQQENKEKRALKVGDRVIILNPNRNQENRGVIITIGASRVTILTATQRRISRAPKNLLLDDNE